MPRLARTTAQGPRLVAFEAIGAVLLITSMTLIGLPGTSALFTADYPDVVTLSAGQIFPDERTSAAFNVSDHASGAAVDSSSPYASAGDGRTATTSAPPASFASDRYVEFHFGALLPGNVALTSASFDLTWASVAGTACLYLEVRESGGSLVDSEGGPGSALSCTSTSTLGDLITPLPGVASTDAANGSRVRAYVTSSAASGLMLDHAVLRATYNGEQFTLYPVDVTDAADGTPSLDHWGLAGP